MFSISIEIHSNTKENAAFYFEKISIVIQELRLPRPYTDEEDDRWRTGLQKLQEILRQHNAGNIPIFHMKPRGDINQMSATNNRLYYDL